MDEYTVVVDELHVVVGELHDDAVVLAVPALRLLVFGRTVDQAASQVRASIASRLGLPRP
jgi:hypothetical protein